MYILVMIRVMRNMIEIIALIRLCIINRRNAKANNRKGWIYVLLTIFLWLGMECLGAIIGLLIFGEHWLTYIVAIIFGISGGILSCFLSARKTNRDSIEG
jgi:hypothetical protein